MKWRLEHIPNLTGKRAMVTGSTGSVGRHVCLELARAGAGVVLAAHDEAAGRRTAEEILRQVPKADLDVIRADLSDLISVRAAARYALGRWPTLDILVNNAGVMATPQQRTADGFELQFGVNHLGHFALTGLLLPALDAARVVTVSSYLHHGAKAVPDVDPRQQRSYHRWRAYSVSKLANLLFMLELDRRAQAAGLKLTSVGAHPGHVSATTSHSGPQLGSPDLAAYLLAAVSKVVGQSAKAGALPLLMAATLPTVAGGTYIGPSRLLELRGSPQPVGMSQAAHDHEAAHRLWVRSEQATGVRYL
jgi:NAD(P)-dependent dehydrogenase (short-subunit alcohol dehydrogenase family)